MSAISRAELDRLNGELLPGRTLLSLVSAALVPSAPLLHPPAATDSAPVVGDAPTAPEAAWHAPHVDTGPAGPAAGPEHETTIAYACQTTTTPGGAGLLGTLGLGAPPSSTMTCVPAAIVER